MVCQNHRLALLWVVLCLPFMLGSDQSTENTATPTASDNPGPPPTPINDTLVQKRAALQKERAEARARLQKILDEEAALEEADRLQHEAELRTQPVTYGSIIKLRHEVTGMFLAGTNFKYFHPHSSYQHQIIATPAEDGYAHWRVMPKVGVRWETLKDVPVAHGDSIRLLNIRTSRCLHSHNGPVSPVSGLNEVTNHGPESGSTDVNDNWQVWIGGGADAAAGGGHWRLGTNVSLLHGPTRAALISRVADEAGAPRLNYTMGHQEVCCRRGDFRAAGAGPDGTWVAWPVPAEAAGMDRHVMVYTAPEDQSGSYTHYNDDPANGPKEISIYCPQDPVVSVSDLDYNLVSEGKCFSLNLQSPHFESSLLLNCAPQKT